MNQKEFLKPPLIDPTLADDKLAEWIDSHTMAVHQFLDKLQQVGLAACGCTLCRRLLQRCHLLAVRP